MRVMIGVDGREASVTAARVALRDLVAADAQSIFVTVVPATPEPGDYAGGIEGPLVTPGEAADDQRARRVAGDAILAEALLELHQGGTQQRVLEGDPGPALCEAAEDEKVDLLVLGPPEAPMIERVLTGSTINYVTRHAPCSVLVVRGDNV